MRILADGTMKPKPSAVKAAEWMAQDPLPMRVMRKGTRVKVFCGAGWDKGKVVEWKSSGITVYLDRRKKTVCCRDNRNIKIEDSSK
jgi:hypothetical protein